MKFNLNIKPRKVYAVEAVLDGDAVFFHVQKLVESKGKLTRTEIGSHIPPSQLKKALKREFPVVLTISGKGIISRKLNLAGEITEDKVLNAILANADVNTFTVQYFQLNENILASAVRSELITGVLSKIPKSNIVTDLYLGDYVSMTLSVFKSYEPMVHVRTYKVKVENSQVIDFEITDTQDDFRFSDEVTPFHLVPGYASGVNHILGIMPSFVGGADWLLFNQQEQAHKYQYNYLRLGLLGILMVALLVNDFMSRSYNAEIETIQKNQNDKLVKMGLLEDLKTSVELKRKFVLSSGIHSQSPISRYSDDVAWSVPKNINLTELTIDPLLKNLSKRNRAAFEFGKMLVKGECKSSQEVDRWIDKLNTFSWNKRAVLVNFIRDNRSGISEFEIEILTNGDLE